MKVTGLTEKLIRDAERQCAEGFRAWLPEVENGTWGSWTELLRHYPHASTTSEHEAHFPLARDGTGVRAQVFFHTRLIILRCIAPAPIAKRVATHLPVSPPPKKRTHHASETPIPSP
jgi:hypothetical protein